MKKKIFAFASILGVAAMLMGQSTVVIRNLPDATQSYGDDEIPCDQTASDPGGQPKKCSTSDLSTFLFGQSDKVTPNLVHTTGQTDEYCLTYEATGTTWEWQTCGSGTGDVTDVFDCATGDCNNITVESSEYLYVAEGGVNQATDVIVVAQNATGATLYKCTAVQIYDFDVPSGLPEMRIADADAIMPATGLLLADTANGASGKVMVAGQLTGADTSTAEGWSAGEALYVNDSGTATSADCGESLTNVRPANTDDSIQKIGTVNRVNATLGKIIVSGANRSNDVPNLQDNYFLLGNATNVATAVTMSGDVTTANTGATTIGNDKILEVMLKAVDAASDEECLTYESTTGDFEWQACGGSDTNAVKEVYFSAAALNLGMAPADNFPAPVHEEGTNIDLDVLAYDDTSDECAGGTFAVPSDIDTSGSATFRIRWYSGTATTGDAMFDFRWHEVGDNESWDGALTTEEAGAITTAGTVDLITLDTWTETLSTLGWAANDVIEFLLCRDADSTGTGTDNLVGDASVIDFAIELPRS